MAKPTQKYTVEYEDGVTRTFDCATLQGAKMMASRKALKSSKSYVLTCPDGTQYRRTFWTSGVKTKAFGWTDWAKVGG